MTITSESKNFNRADSMMTGRESLNERSVEASMSYNLPPHHQSHSTGQGPPQVTNAANAEKVASAKIKVENYIRA